MSSPQRTNIYTAFPLEYAFLFLNTHIFLMYPRLKYISENYEICI